jgi:hypothetical protein
MLGLESGVWRSSISRACTYESGSGKGIHVLRLGKHTCCEGMAKENAPRGAGEAKTCVIRMGCIANSDGQRHRYGLCEVLFALCDELLDVELRVVRVRDHCVLALVSA